MNLAMRNNCVLLAIDAAQQVFLQRECGERAKHLWPCKKICADHTRAAFQQRAYAQKRLMLHKALLSPQEGAAALDISLRSLKSPLWQDRLRAAGAIVESSPGRTKIVAARIQDVIASLPAPVSRQEPPQLSAGKAKKKEEA